MTCTIVAWQPVFTRPETFQIIYDAWKHLQREKQFKLLAYVIVNDPLHWQLSSARNYAGQAGLIDIITDWR